MLVIEGSSTSRHSIKSFVGMGSRGQDFIEDDIMRPCTSDSERRLNNDKVESVTVP